MGTCNSTMQIKYAKNKFFNKNTIHPDPNLWKHKPSPEIIEKCLAITDYPHISKKFAQRNCGIDYDKIENYTKLFQNYDNSITEGYLNEGAELYVPTIVDSRLNLDQITKEYTSLIQFLYEVQCALTEFYVYVNQFQFQFRKTMLPLIDKDSMENIKPFMCEELKKSYGNDFLYTLENANKLAVVYNLYLRLSYSLKITFQYLLASEYVELTKDIEVVWLMCGYRNELHSKYYSLLTSKSGRMFSEYDHKKNILFPNIADDLFQSFTSISGSYTQCNMDGVSAEFKLNKVFEPSPKYQEELISTFANEQFPSRLMGLNAILQLTSDFPNPMLINDEIYSFELSVFAYTEDHSKFIAEFVMFGGIYNHVRDCLNYPLVFRMEPHDVIDSMNHFKEYISAITRTLMLNYQYVLFENKNIVLENQVKKRMSVQVRN